MDRDLEEFVWRRARGICEYGHLPQAVHPLPFQIDHIIAQQHHGETGRDNLALSCLRCNSFKADRWSVTDPLSLETVPLFDPRHDVWTDHFRWSADRTRIIGLTARGRATVEALRLNHPLIVMTRDLWVRAGVHPPKP